MSAGGDGAGRTAHGAWVGCADWELAENSVLYWLLVAFRAAHLQGFKDDASVLRSAERDANFRLRHSNNPHDQKVVEFLRPISTRLMMAGNDQAVARAERAEAALEALKARALDAEEERSERERLTNQAESIENLIGSSGEGDLVDEVRAVRDRGRRAEMKLAIYQLSDAFRHLGEAMLQQRCMCGDSRVLHGGEHDLSCIGSSNTGRCHCRKFVARSQP